MKWPLLKKIIDDVHAINTDAITISGDGEPWLHPQIEKIISYIKNKDLHLTINTNLTFPSLKTLKSFSKTDKLRVNAASLSESLYCKIHDTNSNVYKNLIRNLTIIKRISDINAKPKVTIVYIVTKLNYMLLPKMISSLQKYGITHIEIELMEEKKFTRQLSLNSKQISEFRRLIGNIQKKNIKIECNFDLAKNQKNLCKECYIPYLNSRIEIDGTVAFCCQNHNLTVGNINKDPSFKKLWFSTQAQQIRFIATHAFDINNPLWKPCITCNELSIMQNKAIYLKKKNIKNEK